MSSYENFEKKSYQQHSEHFKEYSLGSKKESHAKTWFQKDTVDAWRHRRMYEILDPLLLNDPGGKWLTVGDGRYGNDAKYILERGSDALATDISDILLKEAKGIGYIDNYKKENAETLSFQNTEFDYVLCKESYHHFPRPMVALYEMLRVASKAVLLIEPNDEYIAGTVLRAIFRNLKRNLKAVFGRNSDKHSFEESGNYIFSISKREIEKVALGLNYKVVVFKGINDAHFPGVEYEKISEKGLLQKKTKLYINLQNVLCRLGFMDYGLLATIIFKQEPTKKLIEQLSCQGYEVIRLPDNPYITN
ncbi:methyltransferase domain-containing protein [Fulvivirga sp. M361]|uniref:class I SAM-dependent methyltransferase n=1 Tax=Fulvivirga sp. M361 TaxID=2594266 RepID=UPI00117B050B|nr:class I SAM-dependent methyltransferase [Fulvivirga sp. M361]TRX51653.1 methyltransferase domain-containing protein [Fulvivirga sp. M361]